MSVRSNLYSNPTTTNTSIYSIFGHTYVQMENNNNNFTLRILDTIYSRIRFNFCFILSSYFCFFLFSLFSFGALCCAPTVQLNNQMNITECYLGCVCTVNVPHSIHCDVWSPECVAAVHSHRIRPIKMCDRSSSTIAHIHRFPVFLFGSCARASLTIITPIGCLRTLMAEVWCTFTSKQYT